MSIVVRLDDRREKARYEQQRQKAVDALRLAAAEFRKLEAFARQGRER